MKVAMSKFPVLTRVGPRYQLTIPKEARKAIGLKVGDLVEARVERAGTITLYPKVVFGKGNINKRLEAAEAAYKQGRYLGPFTKASAAMSAIKRYAHARHPN